MRCRVTCEARRKELGPGPRPGRGKAPGCRVRRQSRSRGGRAGLHPPAPTPLRVAVGAGKSVRMSHCYSRNRQRYRYQSPRDGSLRARGSSRGAKSLSVRSDLSSRSQSAGGLKRVGRRGTVVGMGHTGSYQRTTSPGAGRDRRTKCKRGKTSSLSVRSSLKTYLFSSSPQLPP